MLNLFIEGFMIGLTIAAPVGPIGILCINRTLVGGLRVGLLTGLGAAIADAAYGCIAGFGLVSISKFLLGQQSLIQMAGGLFLIFLGIKTFLSRTQGKIIDNANTLWQDFSSSLILTLTNPATIISFIAIYASLGIVEVKSNYTEAMVIVLGVFLGSLLWWSILSSSITLMSHKLGEKSLKWINRFSGIILLAFGIVAIFITF